MVADTDIQPKCARIGTSLPVNTVSFGFAIGHCAVCPVHPYVGTLGHG